MRPLALIVLTALSAAACAREPGVFLEANARAHVAMLADTIGSRPVGSAANARAREYIIEQLRQFGFEVRVQETDAQRHELGRTARVANIIALLQGERTEAVGLVSHYDSSPYGPGAADAGLGVGVALEAARVFAARPDRRWSLLVVLTDGEEAGLMGAAALVTDRDVTERLHAYINVEAIGSAGTAMLFETGPGNEWLLAPWARHAPHPRGASYGVEIYRRLPNDTDFSILATRNIPGLNFAAALDGYGYHTARDTQDRLSRHALRTAGENVAAVLAALQEVDITQRSSNTPTFFDIGGTVAVTYGPGVQWALAAVALVTGVFTWFRLTGNAVRQMGTARLLLVFAWGWVGALATAGAMVGVTWLLRASREVYHPWYASPGRFFLLLMATGALVGWSVARAGRWISSPSLAPRHPAVAWSVSLPAWIALAAFATWAAPAASYLWVLPLAAAGTLLPWLPRHEAFIRVMSLAVLGVAATLWLRDTHDLLRFAVTVMGRMSVITPVFLYAAVLSAAALMIVPPLIAGLAAGRPIRYPVAMTSFLLLATAASGTAAYLAPAYTVEEPLRRHVRALQDGDSPSSLWEIASLEPGIDLEAGAPGGWMPPERPAGATVPWGRLDLPFVFRTESSPLGPPPVAVSGFLLSPLPDGIQLTLSVVPREAGLTVSFVLPHGVTPARSSLPGTLRLERWTASFVAPPAEGIAWEASFRGVTAEALRETRLAITSTGLPGGSGPQRLPAWLPQERTVWTSTATWIVPATSGPDIPPVPPLR